MYSPPSFMNESVMYSESDLAYPMTMIKQEMNNALLLTSGYYPDKIETCIPLGLETYEITTDMCYFTPICDYFYINHLIETSPYIDPIHSYQAFTPPFPNEWVETDFYESPSPQTIVDSPPKTEKKPKKTIKNPNDRPYPCSMCHRAFARKHDLQRHTRVHTGNKPYACPCCKKAFARTDALKRHLRMEEECRKSHQVQSIKSASKRKFRDL